MPLQKLSALEMFKICKKSVDILSTDFRPISEEGRFEAIIFNSLTAMVNLSEVENYAEIQSNFVKMLFLEAEKLNLGINQKDLRDLMESRIYFFSDELERIYSSETPLPSGTFYLFYGNPLTLKPELSNDLMTLIKFAKPLFMMIDEVNEKSLILKRELS